MEIVPIMGQPDPERICSRLRSAGFTRLTNAFCKSFANHWAAVIFWYTWYNFGRVHNSLRVTPAMVAGISDHIWSVRDY